MTVAVIWERAPLCSTGQKRAELVTWYNLLFLAHTVWVLKMWIINMDNWIKNRDFKIDLKEEKIFVLKFIVYGS